MVTAMTSQLFAAQLKAAGAVIAWRDDTEFDARHGKGSQERSARVWFHRDTNTFADARTGNGGRLRSMTQVRAYLRLPLPPRKTPAQFADELAAKGGRVLWRGKNFDVTCNSATMGERWALVVFHTDGSFGYARSGGNVILFSAAAVRQHLGIDPTPAQRFAAQLVRAGAQVVWSGAVRFEASTGTGEQQRQVWVHFHAATLAFSGASAGSAYLRTKAEVLRALGLNP